LYLRITSVAPKTAPTGTTRSHPTNPAKAPANLLTRHVRAADANLPPTSYVERQNLTMRMSLRRFTRLTNAFSKKVENHGHAIALYFAYYNFVRVHQTLRVTPAIEAGLTDHVWTVEELIALLPVEQPKKRGPYKKAAKKLA